MKKLFHNLFLLLATTMAMVSCEEAETGLVYDTITFGGSNVSWRSDVTEADKAVISKLLDNMVLVESCHFYMGAQSQSTKRANYTSGLSYRDTIWYVAENNAAYQYLRSEQDTVWHNPAFYSFADTLKNKHGYFPYAVVYKNSNGFKVGPVVETAMPDYYIGKYEITQAEWQAVMHRDPKGCYCIIGTESGKAPWYEQIGKGDNYPAYNIWYEDAVDFCQTLSAKTGLNFRLPTEAEWECAARGGKYTHGYKYAGSDTAEDVAWMSSNARAQGLGNDDYGIHPVGELTGNELGLYDMSGNVSEWVANAYYAYNLLNNNNPSGKEVLNNGQDTLMLRGGSWMMEKSSDFFLANRKHCITANFQTEESRQSAFVNCGFRIVATR